MSITDDLLKNNEAYAASFDKGDLPLPPAKKVAVLACMDARLNPYGALGLEEGDAHVIRNAGGVVTDDEIRSLAISQRLLGTEEIILIHHTDCGMLTFTDDDFKKSIQDDTGIKPEWAAEAFPDLDEDVSSRSRASRRARSSRRRTRSAGSSTRSRPASCARSAEPHGREPAVAPHVEPGRGGDGLERLLGGGLLLGRRRPRRRVLLQVERGQHHDVHLPGPQRLLDRLRRRAGRRERLHLGRPRPRGVGRVLVAAGVVGAQPGGGREVVGEEVVVRDRRS